MKLRFLREWQSINDAKRSLLNQLRHNWEPSKWPEGVEEAVLEKLKKFPNCDGWITMYFLSTAFFVVCALIFSVPFLIGVPVRSGADRMTVVFFIVTLTTISIFIVSSIFMIVKNTRAGQQMLNQARENLQDGLLDHKLEEL